MADIGALGALDYRMTFPTQQQQGGGYAQQQPTEVDIPQVDKDPLAVREKLTSDYYNNIGLLRSFAKDMSQKGIDPFKPDYSQDGGGLAFQTMQKLQANLMYSANALGNEFKAETQMRPREASGEMMLRPGVERGGLYYSNPENFMSTKLPVGVEETNQRLAQETNDPQSQARANQLLDLQVQRLDQQVAQGLMRPEEAEYYKQQLVPNKWRTQPFAPRAAHGLSQEDVSQRAQLIKQIKTGIIKNDQTPLNILKLVPGIEDVQYVNTGDKVGLEIWARGQSQPSFIDLSTGGGEGDINAFLNRIEGQKNVPNEAVFNFDTKVQIPQSNVGQVIADVKNQIKSFSPEVVSKLQGLASAGDLTTATGEPISSVEINGPIMGVFGKTELRIKHFKVIKGKVDYSKTETKDISDPQELDQFIQTNANQIAPAFGGGFQPPSGKSIKESDIAAKAAAAGYTPEEYMQLLQQRGIQIVK